MKKILIATLFGTAMALSAPAAGQTPNAAAARELAYTPGTYWNVQGIFIEDGQYENYMDYVATTYRRSQDFARRNGWISGYTILANVNRRDNEPHLYLITQFPRLATPQEDLDRDRRMNEYMEQTARQATESSGQRVSMRRLGSNLLLQELNLRPAR
jgi:hypothetical protein